MLLRLEYVEDATWLFEQLGQSTRISRAGRRGRNRSLHHPRQDRVPGSLMNRWWWCNRRLDRGHNFIFKGVLLLQLSLAPLPYYYAHLRADQFTGCLG